MLSICKVISQLTVSRYLENLIPFYRYSQGLLILTCVKVTITRTRTSGIGNYSIENAKIGNL